MSNYCTKEFTLHVAAENTWAVSECWGFVYDLNFTGNGSGATWNPDSRLNAAAPCPFPPFTVESQWLFCVNASITLGPFDVDRLITVSGSVDLNGPAGTFACGFIPSMSWSYIDISMTGLVGYSGSVSLHAEDPVTNPGAIPFGIQPFSLSGTLPALGTTLLSVALDAGSSLAVSPTKPTSNGSLTIVTA